jgi:CRISPR-associated protein Cas6
MTQTIWSCTVMNIIDLLFPVVGSCVRTDHAYAQLAAFCHLLPRLHDGTIPVSIAPISGQYIGDGLLQINPKYSRLRARLPLQHVPDILPLAGKSFQIMGQRIHLGVPQIRALAPASALFARTVTIKHATEVPAFIAAARKQLDALNVGGQLEIPSGSSGTHEGEPHRHVMRIKETRIVCFSLLVRDLNPDESLRLQELGLGGRRRMGGGLFVPATEELHP